MLVITPNGDWCAITSEADVTFIDDTGWTDDDYECLNGWTQFRLLDFAYKHETGVLSPDTTPTIYDKQERQRRGSVVNKQEYVYMMPEGECAYCDRARETGDKSMPSHTASPRCQSGSRIHCTCDTCY